MTTSRRRQLAATVSQRPLAGPRRRAFAALLAATCVGVVALPMTALATTGTQTDKRTVVTITDKGVTWVPTLSKLKVVTGVTVRLDVVNKASAKHSFELGKRKTKVLSPGTSYVFYYVFDTPGTVAWQVGLGDVTAAAFHGSYKVDFPPHFN
jgi:hypothetical protein